MHLAAALIAVVLTGAGCAGKFELSAGPTDGAGLTWFEPAHAPDRGALQRWRDQVGPPVVSHAGVAAARPASSLTVVTWNTHVGGADIASFVGSLRARLAPGAPFVLLLQEVWRGGLDTPAALAPAAAFADRLGDLRDGTSADIVGVAARLGLSVYYVPSMRNGSPVRSDEDRGNAILANVPLSDLAAIELPFERQRRVAVAATVYGQSAEGRPWTLRVVSAHLDNMVGARRLWVAGSEYARARQARALVQYLAGSDASLLAGDFNTWFGFADRAYEETARAFPDAPPTDRRATFHGLLRLDHMFFRLPDGWQASYRREDDRYGSDHHPLIATVTFGR